MAAERKHVRLLPELVPDIILPDQTLRHIIHVIIRRILSERFCNLSLTCQSVIGDKYSLKLSTFLVCFCHNYTIYRTNNIKLSYFYKILQTNKLSPWNFSVSYSYLPQLYLVLFLFWKFSGPFKLLNICGTCDVIAVYT